MIHYAPEALDDVDRLAAWLQDRDAKLAQRFLSALRRTTARIQARPLLYPLLRSDEARKCLMRFGRSVYVLYYVVEGPDQIILRVWHGREQRK